MKQDRAHKFLDALHKQLTIKGRALDRNFIFQLILSSIALYHLLDPATVIGWIESISFFGVKIDPSLFIGLLPILIFVLIYQQGIGIGWYLRKCELFQYWLIEYLNNEKNDKDSTVISENGHEHQVRKIIARSLTPDNFVYQIYQHLKINSDGNSEFLDPTYDKHDFIEDLKVKNKKVPFIFTYVVSSIQGISQGVLLCLIMSYDFEFYTRAFFAGAVVVILGISYYNIIVDRAVSLGSKKTFENIVYSMTVISIITVSALIFGAGLF